MRRALLLLAALLAAGCRSRSAAPPEKPNVDQRVPLITRNRPPSAADEKNAPIVSTNVPAGL